MPVEYGRRGLIGVLTPQANTTVEPELAILLPPGVALVNARLVSDRPTILDRLAEYFTGLDRAVAQFANAPVDTIAIACTGASYLVGRAREDALVDGLSQRIGRPVVTSGRAVGDALRALGARRIALVSPYPPELTAASLPYWRDHGAEIARVVTVGAAAPDAFHPIYAMPADDARAALAGLAADGGADAVVMLGTGMPTLGPILAHPRIAGAPVLSCMLATAWRAVLALGGATPDAASLLAWIERPHWAARYAERMGAA